MCLESTHGLYIPPPHYLPLPDEQLRKRLDDATFIFSLPLLHLDHIFIVCTGAINYIGGGILALIRRYFFFTYLCLYVENLRVSLLEIRKFRVDSYVIK